jgi:hypothetical protein
VAIALWICFFFFFRAKGKLYSSHVKYTQVQAQHESDIDVSITCDNLNGFNEASSLATSVYTNATVEQSF